MPRKTLRTVTALIHGLALCYMASSSTVHAHDGHHSATYKVTPADTKIKTGKYLRLRILGAETGRPLAARFTMTVNGSAYIPPTLGTHGLRFVSVHQRRKQQFIATYARGTGDVLVPVRQGARTGTVTVAKGFEFVPETVSFEINDLSTTVEVKSNRWINLQEEGWHAADEHLHYERTDPKHDRDWLTMLNADGLSHAHFLVLRGGNLSGIWAQQYAYGKAGEASDGTRLIRPGEEYRDSTQGHINLLGVEKVIQPISTGGIGEPRIQFNYPPLLDVFRRAHELGGIGGPAHGGSLARSSTASLDTVLGEVDFFEIANTHLYKTDVWYRLLNCGFIVPPVGGTDLPNFGFRDPWQPLLGEIRTYVRSGKKPSFEAWKQAVREGEVFVTSGPIIRLEIDDVGPGGVVRLPSQGGTIKIKAEMASPLSLDQLEIVSMSKPITFEAQRTFENDIYRLAVNAELTVTNSCWIAARGVGVPKVAVEHGLGIQQNVIAHTGVIKVLVGDQPIRSKSDIKELRKQLLAQQEHYRTKARYEKPEHRSRIVGLFDQALKRLE